jgi:DNA invertase Pin-like site-specific DNA recombinase
VPKVGYARVSTSEQDLTLQKDALNEIGCERIFTDHASGAKTDRPGLIEALSYVRDGDVLVVWKFDRLGRSLPHLIETVTDLNARRIGLRSLTENIDTTTPGDLSCLRRSGRFRTRSRQRAHHGGACRRCRARSTRRATPGRHAR